MDLSAKCDGWIYDPNGSGIQNLGIRSRDPFSGSTVMSASEAPNTRHNTQHCITNILHVKCDTGGTAPHEKRTSKASRHTGAQAVALYSYRAQCRVRDRSIER